MVMFVVERPNFRLTKGFYIWAFIIILGATEGVGWFAALLTMHIHLAPKKMRETARNRLNPTEVPDCDLPALANREGPHEYKGYPYYSYPNGDVDGYTRQGWWRLSFKEFKRHVDKITSA
jgi:hypothetical protein